MRAGIHGDPAAMHALAQELAQAASQSRMLILAFHAHLEEARVRGRWDDMNHADLMRRVQAVRDIMEPRLQELTNMTAEIHGLAEQYARLTSR